VRACRPRDGIAPEPGHQATLHPVPGKLDVQLDSDPASLSARVADPDAVGHALAELSRSDVAVTEFALGQPSLDEVFLALTGHAADDHATEQVAA
jgi:ABC-2 type transport system ATP-binding protein